MIRWSESLRGDQVQQLAPRTAVAADIYRKIGRIVTVHKKNHFNHCPKTPACMKFRFKWMMNSLDACCFLYMIQTAATHLTTCRFVSRERAPERTNYSEWEFTANSFMQNDNISCRIIKIFKWALMTSFPFPLYNEVIKILTMFALLNLQKPKIKLLLLRDHSQIFSASLSMSNVGRDDAEVSE